MDNTDFIFLGSVVGVFVATNIFFGLYKILNQENSLIDPPVDIKDENSGYFLLVIFIFLFTGLPFDFICKSDSFAAITLIITSTALSSLLLRANLFFPFEFAAKYLLLLPAKTIVKTFIVYPFKFLKMRQWGQIILWLSLVTCLTWTTYFLFDIKFFSKNSTLLLLAAVSVLGTVLVFRRSYKK